MSGMNGSGKQNVSEARGGSVPTAVSDFLCCLGTPEASTVLSIGVAFMPCASKPIPISCEGGAATGDPKDFKAVSDLR